ncbi:MAG: putative nuclease with RNAse H fold [Verrucomicrobiales bacterium]|jgi:predicted nuclease with RNAse H fold
MSRSLYLGIDVGVDRGCAFTALDERANMIESGWFDRDLPPGLMEFIQHAATTGRTVHIGIDSPRCPVPEPRKWYWNGITREWRERSREQGSGRHCEVVLKAHGLGNPQWTPLASSVIPDWMKVGFDLYKQFENIDRVFVHEVYPAASYILLEGEHEPRISLDFSEFRVGPKDLLDACVAAATVREFALKRGCAVGGGDGLGPVVLPRKLKVSISQVMDWPDAGSSTAAA